MTIREKILIVEDEKSIAHFISTILTTNGYETILAKTGTEAMTMLSSHCPDLVILDLGLPDMDGIEVLRSLRGWSSLPVVVVSARTHENDKVEALDLGADDYLTKPFGTAELLARVRTAIRHTRTTSPTGEIAQRGTYSVGEMVIDYNKHQVLVRGENVRLTLSEFRIVALLGKFAGKVLTYDYIIKELWGPRAGGDNQILRVNMANIRRKIEKNPAEPEYLFTEAVPLEARFTLGVSVHRGRLRRRRCRVPGRGQKGQGHQMVSLPLLTPQTFLWDAQRSFASKKRRRAQI